VTNPHLIELAMQVVQQTSNNQEEHNPVPEPAPHEPVEAEKPPPLPTASENVGLPHTAPAKEKKTADELAAMILGDLSQMEGYPKRGVRVTVYGSNPWNAWLAFGGAAGPVRNKADLQRFCEIITERLKRRYDV
jgi:hypothetical protein